MNIISTIFAVIMVVVTAVVICNLKIHGDFGDLLKMSGIQMFFALLEVAIALVSFAYCCRIVCCSSSHHIYPEMAHLQGNVELSNILKTAQESGDPKQMPTAPIYPKGNCYNIFTVVD